MLTIDVRLAAGPVPADAGAVAFFVRPGDERPSVDATPDVLGALTPVDIDGHLSREKVRGEAGEITAIPTFSADGVTVLFFVGIGAGEPAQLRKAAAALVRRARDSVTLWVGSASLPAADLAIVAESLLLASYRFTRKSEPKPGALTTVTLAVDNDESAPQRALDAAVVRARAVAAARDLANTPSLEKSPETLADTAAAIAAEHDLSIRVWDETALESGGFGGIVGVGSGSVRPPRLIELAYRPDGAQRHIVLVGKGITFDSGGLSIKPAEGMPLMKTDMSGGAAVLAVMGALRALQSPVAVTGLVAAAENMPSGSALRPGDVLRHYDGRTSEVLNTDAEGRLVLADAIGYAVAELAPDAIVDLATLTGAASLGLGKRHGAFYATDEALAAELLAAAAVAGERWWRMPLVEDYVAALESPLADLANISTNPHINGGSIVAALYLREFTGGVPWAHLDMAGPARADRDEDEVTKGATGFAVRTLLTWLA